MGTRPVAALAERPARQLRSRFGAAILALLAALADEGVAAGPGQLEYEVKAVFLLRIAQFTEWPAPLSSGAPEIFRFCVMGADPFGTLLDDVVRDERIGGRPAVVRRLPATGPATECDLLFMSASIRTSVPQVLAGIAGNPTLTVADFTGFVREGGAVELYVEEGYVRFRIDRRAAQAAGLELRSQLLRAASSVDGG
jgi:hypothetical protein